MAAPKGRRRKKEAEVEEMTSAVETDEIVDEVDEAEATETEENAEQKEQEPRKRTRRPRGSATSSRTKKEVSYSKIVQFGNDSYDVDEIVSNAEATFKNENKRKRYEEFRVYIKPEEEKAYYVARYGDKEYVGSVPIA